MPGNINISDPSSISRPIKYSPVRAENTAASNTIGEVEPKKEQVQQQVLLDEMSSIKAKAQIGTVNEASATSGSGGGLFDTIKNIVDIAGQFKNLVDTMSGNSGGSSSSGNDILDFVSDLLKSMPTGNSAKIGEWAIGQIKDRIKKDASNSNDPFAKFLTEISDIYTDMSEFVEKTYPNDKDKMMNKLDVSGMLQKVLKIAQQYHSDSSKSNSASAINEIYKLTQQSAAKLNNTLTEKQRMERENIEYNKKVMAQRDAYQAHLREEEVKRLVANPSEDMTPRKNEYDEAINLLRSAKA